MRMYMAIEKANSFAREKIVNALREVEWQGVVSMGAFDEYGNAKFKATLAEITTKGDYRALTP